MRQKLHFQDGVARSPLKVEFFVVIGGGHVQEGVASVLFKEVPTRLEVLISAAA